MKRALIALLATAGFSTATMAQVPPANWTRNYIPTLADWQAALLYNGQSLPSAIDAERQRAEAAEASKVATENGTSTGQTLVGAQIPTMPTDIPGATGTAVPNTGWVDKFYASLAYVASYFVPKSWFVLSNTTWTVCASGCNYTSPLDAWNAAMGANYLNGATLTISIADGTYNLANQFFTSTPNTYHVHVIGDTANPASVILNFTNVKGTNLNGFAAYNGGVIGLIDGVTIQAPADGTGAFNITNSSGQSTWWPNSYGSGVQAFGSGSNIQLGSHIVINWFYYSVLADNNGGVYAPSGGVSGYHAGDVNFMARGGGVIVCTPCYAEGAADGTWSGTLLGSNYDAERGGTLYIDGSTGKWGIINGIAGITGGAIWAHNVKLLGGLNLGGNAIAMWSGAHGEFAGCTVSGGYANGADIEDTSFADLSNCNISGNQTGIYINGGRARGASITIMNNSQYGISVIHGGQGIFYSTYALMSGNATQYAVQPAGTSAVSGSTYTASSLDLQ